MVKKEKRKERKNELLLIEPVPQEMLKKAFEAEQK